MHISEEGINPPYGELDLARSFIDGKADVYAAANRLHS